MAGGVQKPPRATSGPAERVGGVTKDPPETAEVTRLSDTLNLLDLFQGGVVRNSPFAPQAMMARCLLLLLAAGVAAAETSESAKPAAPLRPNIIFNLVDGGSLSILLRSFPAGSPHRAWLALATVADRAAGCRFRRPWLE